MRRFKATVRVITQQFGRAADYCLLSRTFIPSVIFVDQCVALVFADAQYYAISFSLTWRYCRLFHTLGSLRISPPIPVTSDVFLQEFGLHAAFAAAAKVSSDWWFKSGHVFLSIKADNINKWWCWSYLPSCRSHLAIQQLATSLDLVVSQHLVGTPTG
jgi:hypothetical protein